MNMSSITTRILAEHRRGRLCQAAQAYEKADPIELSEPARCRVVIPAVDHPEAMPLLCVLHGYGRDDGGLADHAMRWAEDNDALVLLPQSREASWDVLHNGYGPDVAHLDAVLFWALRAFSIDRSRFAIAGFSDGASYALTLGLKNGDCFSHVMAFSPGFAMASDMLGQPELFVAHGRADAVLPVACARGITERLKRDDYVVTYDEFQGGHHVPKHVAYRGFSKLSLSSDKGRRA